MRSAYGAEERVVWQPIFARFLPVGVRFATRIPVCWGRVEGARAERRVILLRGEVGINLASAPPDLYRVS
ncbi:MAG: hypothetical protein HQL57_01280 [Magnetococcales bacterium]|nr:hypothetical protein [Magnetococcales bacterium]